MEDSLGKVTFAADFGGGQQVDVEFPATNGLWVAAGPGIEVADIWLKEVTGVGDLRVRIMRLGKALEVSIDRGEQNANWWPPEAPPRLLIVFDPVQGRASATATAGAAEQTRSVELGKVSY